MSLAAQASRRQLWLESLGDWSWPGRRATAELLPPAWVPATPAPAASPALPADWRLERAASRGLGRVLLLAALAAAAATAALGGPARVEQLIASRAASGVATVAAPRPTEPPPAALAPAPVITLPTLRPYIHDAAGSSVEAASFTSAALGGANGSFYVYLPARAQAGNARFPVLYLLHGRNQSAGAFLELGLQGELDALIAHHVIPPLIAVMIQGGEGPIEWQGAWAHYVLETQDLVDHRLPTIPARGARAIAGASMGGYGAMHLALADPERFGVVESWLGRFNGLGALVRRDRPVIEGLGLHAFLYGGASDHIVGAGENAPFAAVLRAAGADAHSAVYPGDHSMGTLEAHLAGMLTFAGRALAGATQTG
jgi:S-formylglutathione hydrolase FrmB